MTSSREDYLILIDALRKMDMDENYKPTDRELRVVASLLEQEEKYSPKQSNRRKNYMTIRLCEAAINRPWPHEHVIYDC
jgi:hypothetical protein